MKRNLIGAEAQQQMILSPNTKGELSYLSVLSTIDQVVKTYDFGKYVDLGTATRTKVIDTSFECNPKTDMGTILIKTNVQLQPSIVGSNNFENEYFGGTDPILESVGSAPLLALAVFIDYKTNTGRLALGFTKDADGEIMIPPQLPSGHFKETLKNAANTAISLLNKFFSKKDLNCYLLSNIALAQEYTLVRDLIPDFTGSVMLSGVLDSRQTTEFFEAFRELIVQSGKTAEYPTYADACSILMKSLQGETPLHRIRNIQKATSVAMGWHTNISDKFAEDMMKSKNANPISELFEKGVSERPADNVEAEGFNTPLTV